MDDAITNFFTPHGVVVIGASTNPTKLGYRLSCNLIQSGYGGAIHLVNPRGGDWRQFAGCMTEEQIAAGRIGVYRSIAETPDPADLAVLLIPAEAAATALRECGERGIRSVIISAGGFREAGAAGLQRELECLDIARQYGMRLMGPNCIGVIDTHTPLDTSFLPPPGPAEGHVAFISHSGAVCDVVIDWGRGQGLGLSRLVSLGNQADLTETELLAPVAADPQTRVIALYMESVRDGRRFVAEASRAARSKPIVAIKVGRSASGQRAASSHTGALAGQDAAFDAAFRRAGILRAQINEELYHWAHALAWCPLPRGGSVAILTNAGGPGVIAADALESVASDAADSDVARLRLAELQPATQETLRSLLPEAASLRNPVDMLGTASASQYAGCLKALLADDNVHGVIVIIPPPPVDSPPEIARQIIPMIQQSDKPALIALMGGSSMDSAARSFQAAHIPEYRFPEQAVSALAALARRAAFLAQPPQPPATLAGIDPEAVRRLLDSETPDIFQILSAYGLPTPAVAFADSAQGAAEAASALGLPVVLKVVSSDITHKSDVGGVLLNLGDAAAVQRGFATIRANVQKAAPGALMQGVLVQRMIPAGQEVIIGVTRDAQFGPLVMFGSGGVEVEGLRDIAFELAPLPRAEAEKMLDRTWAGRKLHGYRNLPPADRAAAVEALLRLAQLAVDFPQIEEIEINPLRVLPAGQGAVAVDARFRLKV